VRRRRIIGDPVKDWHKLAEIHIDKYKYVYILAEFKAGIKTSNLKKQPGFREKGIFLTSPYE
jgi:hypothetical protein